MRERDIKIFYDTLKRTQEQYPISTDVRYYDGVIACNGEVMSADFPPITMVHGGTVNTGYFEAEDMRVAILNFADAIKYGGWVEEGAQTQEENICRCTNIYPVLGSKESHKHYYAPNMATLKNRAEGDYGHYGYADEVYTDRIIYIRDATIFRDDTTYELVEPRKVDVITCPAPSAQMNPYSAYEVFKTRIEQIVFSAIDNKAECIVLGAWGCGAFGQEPEIIAMAFANVLNLCGRYFKKIVFAIKPTPHWGEDDLYDTFEQILSKAYRGGTV